MAILGVAGGKIASTADKWRIWWSAPTADAFLSALAWLNVEVDRGPVADDYARDFILGSTH